ncbi:hypothetical protein INR49_026649 [Caranx melampygus]|nr:hypothetical protein INR49_026649 [Caranx melampygus]
MVIEDWLDSFTHAVALNSASGIMGNLISRPSCLGQKSKHVRSDEDFLKECYQRRREWQSSEQHGENKREEAVKDKAGEDANKEKEVETDKEAQEIDYNGRRELILPSQTNPSAALLPPPSGVAVLWITPGTAALHQ